jgi:catechol 2,3-dioxygenase-like lactoylglutathione lyase family enzyme
MGPMFRAPQITFYSEHLERLRDFYLALGFQERFQHPPEGVPIHVELVLDGFNLGIADVESARKDHGLSPELSGRAAELVLWCDDTDAEYARLSAAGSTGLSEPHDWLGDLRIAWIADPDGNPIQLVQHAGAKTL